MSVKKNLENKRKREKCKLTILFFLAAGNDELNNSAFFI